MKLTLKYIILVKLIQFFFIESSLAQQPHHINYKLTEKEANEIVLRVLKTNPVIDGHNDISCSFYYCKNCPRGINDFRLDSGNNGNTNIPLDRKGGVGAHLYNICTSDTTTESLIKAFDLMHQLPHVYPNDFEVAGSSKQLRTIMQHHKIGMVPIEESAILLHDSIALLQLYYKLGLRSLTFAYKTNDFADGSNDTAKYHGISPLGKEMIKEMNRLGIMIDMSHISADAMRAILKETQAPVIFSHSNAYTLCKVNRNVPDDVLLALKKNKGIIMINFVPYFISQQHADWVAKSDSVWDKKLKELKDTDATNKYVDEVWTKENPEPLVTVSEVADHFDYIKKLIGVDYIGIGSDLGITYDLTIKDMKDASCFPLLLKELARRGWTEAELKKITDENFLRVFEEVERRSKIIKTTANRSIAKSRADTAQ